MYKIVPISRNKAVITLTEKGYDIKLDGSKQPIQITDNQMSVLRSIGVTDGGKTASQLAKEVGMTHAGILYIVAPLLDKRILGRQNLPGGVAVYYLLCDIAEEELSPELLEVKKGIERQKRKNIQSLTVAELTDALRSYSKEVRHQLVKWILDGGWRPKP